MIVRNGRVFSARLGAPALLCGVDQDRYLIQGFGRLVSGGNAVAAAATNLAIKPFSQVTAALGQREV